MLAGVELVADSAVVPHAVVVGFLGNIGHGGQHDKGHGDGQQRGQKTVALCHGTPSFAHVGPPNDACLEIADSIARKK